METPEPYIIGGKPATRQPARRDQAALKRQLIAALKRRITAAYRHPGVD